MAEEFSKKELDMRQALKTANRRKAAKFALQTGGAFADVRGGASIADAVNARPLYPEVKTAVQKAQESADIVKKMADMEEEYFSTQLNSATQRYSSDLAYAGGNFRAAASASVAANNAKAAGLRFSMTLLERQRDKTSSTEGSPIDGFKGKWVKDTGSQERLAKNVEDQTSKEAAYAGLEEFPTSDQAVLGALPTEEIGLRQEELDAVTAATVQKHGDREWMATATDEDMVRAHNENLEVAAFHGVNVEQLYRDQGIDPALATQLGANAIAKQQADYKQMSEKDKQLLHMSYGGLSTKKTQQAQRELEEKYFGAGDEVDAQGNPILDEEGNAKTETMDNSKFLVTSDKSQMEEPDGLVKLQNILTQIQDQPELDESHAARKQILESAEFAAYRTSRGYETASDKQALGQYNKELNAGLQTRNKDFAQKRKENLESGLDRSGLRNRMKRAVGVSEAAKVAGGSDVG